jgi:hypothetical protein
MKNLTLALGGEILRGDTYLAPFLRNKSACIPNVV